MLIAPDSNALCALLITRDQCVIFDEQKRGEKKRYRPRGPDELLLL